MSVDLKIGMSAEDGPGYTNDIRKTAISLAGISWSDVFFCCLCVSGYLHFRKNKEKTKIQVCKNDKVARRCER